ncbi:MAG: response regulator [Desulfobacterales bacterium]|nr:response regulator [Desulfobacterales bacterium]
METTASATVLVIDDEPSILRLIQKRLKSWNYRVMTAESGKRAVEILADEQPGVVITDLFMPEMDGFEVLGHIQRTAPDLPVIVLSGQGALGDAIQALRRGAWDYIYKPIEEMAFLRMSIEKVLEKARLIAENRNYRNHLERLVARKSVALAASEKRYRTVADFTYNWELWLDPEGKIEYISPSCERVTGFFPRAFIEDPSLLQTIIHPDDRSLFEGHLQSRGICGGPDEVDFRIIRRDGQVRWIGHSCQPVNDNTGLNLGRRCSNRDITYRKQIETDLVAKQKDLLEKTVNLEKANKALKSLLDQRETETLYRADHGEQPQAVRLSLSE